MINPFTDWQKVPTLGQYVPTLEDIREDQRREALLYIQSLREDWDIVTYANESRFSPGDSWNC